MAKTRQRSGGRRGGSGRSGPAPRRPRADTAARRGARPGTTRTHGQARPPRRKALRRRWLAALTVLGVLGVGYLLLFTSLLGVRSVEITGLQTLSEQQVRDTAAVPDRRAMLRVDTDAIRDRVTTLPGVAGAEVSRSLPSTIEIAVTEREGVAFYTDADGVHIVDGNGVAFSTSAEPPDGLPKLELGSVASDDGRTRAVLGVLSAIPRQLRDQVTAASAQTPGSVHLTLDDGKMVQWGDAQRSERKAKVLAALLSQEGRRYDVSSPELPTVS